MADCKEFNSMFAVEGSLKTCGVCSKINDCQLPMALQRKPSMERSLKLPKQEKDFYPQYPNKNH